MQKTRRSQFLTIMKDHISRQWSCIIKYLLCGQTNAIQNSATMKITVSIVMLLLLLYRDVFQNIVWPWDDPLTSMTMMTSEVFEALTLEDRTVETGKLRRADQCSVLLFYLGGNIVCYCRYLWYELISWSCQSTRVNPLLKLQTIYWVNSLQSYTIFIWVVVDMLS